MSFDGELVENQAVTLERLGRSAPPPHALAATVQRWLGLGRRVWIDVRGRQIQGIATARERGSREAWEIDTLVDAAGGDCEVALALLAQAVEAATESEVGHLVLRMRADAPALGAAHRAGFEVASRTRLWAGRVPRVHSAAAETVAVRAAEAGDALALFQLQNRVLPLDQRRVLGMTLEEWGAVREHLWAGRGAEYVAECEGRMVGVVRAGGSQFWLLCEPGADEAARALLRAAARHLDGNDVVLALLPDCTATPVSVLREAGFEAGEEYVLLGRRTAQVVRDAVPARAVRAIPTRG
jgi:hypothetical protein